MLRQLYYTLSFNWSVKKSWKIRGSFKIPCNGWETFSKDKTWFRFSLLQRIVFVVGMARKVLKIKEIGKNVFFICLYEILAKRVHLIYLCHVCTMIDSWCLAKYAFFAFSSSLPPMSLSYKLLFLYTLLSLRCLCGSFNWSLTCWINSATLCLYIQ